MGLLVRLSRTKRTVTSQACYKAEKMIHVKHLAYCAWYVKSSKKHGNYILIAGLPNEEGVPRGSDDMARLHVIYWSCTPTLLG